MYAPKSYSVTEEKEHTVVLNDDQELTFNQVILGFHCARCLSTLGYREGTHGVQCNRCASQEFITNADWKRYRAWAKEYSEHNDDYIAQHLERGLQQRFEDISYYSTHTVCGGGEMMTLPPHLRKGK
jgi:DNA-directed RNA polymerase subunit RPC12/RpoP